MKPHKIWRARVIDLTMLNRDDSRPKNVKLPVLGLPAATLALVFFATLGSEALCADIEFAPPRTYANPAHSSNLDLSPQKATYIALGTASYQETLVRSQAMRSAIEHFIDDPSAANLDLARAAWVFARQAYTQTEVFRFNDGPIDAPASGQHAAGPEMRINTWPVDESTIDYVRGIPASGLINELETPLTIEAILARDQTGDESAVTTGWHAIEFLLWSQDLRADGPGDRNARDYQPGTRATDRRREYLSLVTHQLLSDLEQVEHAWRAGDPRNYYAQLTVTPAIEVVGRALHGATSFLALELFGERFSVALDSGSQEDEHSCFSDTTHLDLQNGITGVANLLRGDFLGKHLGPGVLEVIAFQDPGLAVRMNRALDNAIEKSGNLKPPFDRLIRLPASHPDHVDAEAALAAFHELALSMKASAEALGIQIVVPGV